MALSVLLLAWIVWMKTIPRQGDPKPTWEIVESTTEEQTCRAMARDRQNREANNIAYDITFYCLPDTADPRPRQ
jgi:hypothetical protein